MSNDGFEQRQAHEDDMAAERWDSLMLDEQLADEANDIAHLDAPRPNEREDLQAARHAFHLSRLALKRAYQLAVDPTVEPASGMAALRDAHLEMLLARGDLLRAMLRATQTLRQQGRR